VRIRLGIYSENNGLLGHLTTTMHNSKIRRRRCAITYDEVQRQRKSMMQRVTRCAETILMTTRDDNG